MNDKAKVGLQNHSEHQFCPTLLYMSVHNYSVQSKMPYFIKREKEEARMRPPRNSPTISNTAVRGRGSIHEIGDRIQEVKKHKLDTSSSFARRLWVVVTAIMLSFIVTHAIVFIVVEVAVDSFSPNRQHEEQFNYLERKQHDQIRKNNTLCTNDCHDTAWKVTDTSPQSTMNDDEFLVYIAILIWATVLLAGFGCELLFMIMFSRQGWSDKLETLWRLAQFVFPLFLLTVLGLAMLRNFMALPLLVFGLWKFGFPETISYMYTALYGSKKARAKRLADVINSSGMTLHHSSATMVIASMLAGVIPANRYTVGAPLVTVMQHWFILMKYVNVWVYDAIQLTFELFFQWVVLSDLEYLYAIHWTVTFGALGVLTAHWFILVAAAINILSYMFHYKGHVEVEHEKALDSIRQPVGAAACIFVEDQDDRGCFEEAYHDEEEA